MKLLFVSKRSPQQRDLIERPYGRFNYLPILLASMGHDVRVILCSHTRMPALEREQNGVHWHSYDLREFGLSGLLKRIRNVATSFDPDWTIGLSDAWYGWLAQYLSRITGSRLAVDAYDNYEAYIPWNFPLHFFWRRSISAADLVTAAGPQLATLLTTYRKERSPATIIPMAADPAFAPCDRTAARARLSLPADAPLFGYFGSWGRKRSTNLVLEAFDIVHKKLPSARLVLSGRPPAHALSSPGAHPLGYIDDALLPLALSSLDAACVITADTAFGRYSYPAKLCEAMACGVPVIATETDPVRWMLHDDTRFLTPIGDAREIADRMLALLGTGRIIYPQLPTWESSAHLFEQALLKNS